MPQDPFLIDQIDIEPGSAGTRRINRDAGTGGLAFQDVVVTSPLTLVQLAGLRAIGNVFIVGKSGAGAQYTTIQSAINDVPAAASVSNPYIIVVLPGRYDETVNIARDGVHLVGIGQPELRSALEATPDAAGNDHTLVISNALGTPPLFCLIRGFKITNAHTNKACIRVVGSAASTLLQTPGLFLEDCLLEANSAAGNYPLWASTAGRVTAYGCTLTSTSALSLLLLQEMSRTLWRDCSIFPNVSHRYDTAEDEPALAGGLVFFQNCPDIAAFSALVPAIAIDCDGSGASTFQNCTVPTGVRVEYSGDQSHAAFNSFLGDLSLLETVTLTTRSSKHASILAANANAVLDIDVQRGTATLAAAASVAVVFDVPMSDADYVVDLELPSRPTNDETPWVSVKAATGFTINFFTAQTMTVSWTATRR